MTVKALPFTLDQLEAIAAQVPTPFHVYDEKAMRANARAFYQGFSWVPGGFKNFYAVKALPNPHILEILRGEGMGGDCSSFAELLLCEAAGIKGEDIIFTSNNTPAYEYQKARHRQKGHTQALVTALERLEKTRADGELASQFDTLYGDSPTGDDWPARAQVPDVLPFAKWATRWLGPIFQHMTEPDADDSESDHEASR